MSWYRSLGVTEIVFIGAFLLFYGLYLARVIRIGRRLNTPYATVFIKLFIRTLAFALIIIAILGPSFGGSQKEVRSVGKDIMICVDLSKSMDAFDIQPTRLEKVKHELKKLVAAFTSDRIGIVIFGNEAFVQCPLTYDQNALNLFIEALNTNLIPVAGTDFGPALRMALKKLEEDDSAPNEAKSKIIVLISDGEDFGKDTDEIIREIDRRDIKLFTLGVGTERGGNIYAGNALKKDREGAPVLTKLNPDGLKSLAQRTEGQYFEINDSRNDLSRMISAISRIEGSLRDTRFVDVTSNKYFYFLAAAAFLLMLDVLLNIRTIRI